MNFIRHIEDFICEKCSAAVAGDGYTNHCPKCLWSMHVDMEPGDRKAECGGMMEPVACEREGDEWMLTHTCVACGCKKRNRMSPKDDFNAAVVL